jgi:pilus assembly protein Flp/PilA
MLTRLKRLAIEDEGADATEYALLAALVAMALIGGATFMGDRLNWMLNSVGNKVNTTTIP